MKVAVPLTSTAAFSPHFGASSQFEVFDIDRRRQVRRRMIVVPESSLPCEWPRLLRTAGVQHLIVRNIGPKAERRLAEHGIQIVRGAREATPDELVASWLAGELKDQSAPCDRKGAHRFAPLRES